MPALPPIVGSEPADDDLTGLIEQWDKRVALRKGLQKMGRQIQHLAALFHEFEDHFEREEATFRQNWPQSSDQDAAVLGKRKQPTPSCLEGEVADVDRIGAKFRSHDGLSSAIQENDVAKVQAQLQKTVDPNAAWTNATLHGNQFVSVSPLAAAVLQRNAAIVHMLVCHKASLESEYSVTAGAGYSFTAGAKQNIWTGTVVNACVPSNSLDMLKYLVQNRADVHALSSDGANLVWQAAYFGHKCILEYLIDCGVSLECSAVSQEGSALKYSPLHQAAISGHESVVSLLLEARADVRVDNGQGRQPLDDAVYLAHPGIVKQLVMNNADLMGVRSPATLFMQHPQTRSLTPKSNLAHILDSQNQVLISMLAQGLSRAPKLLDGLSINDFLRFLCEPGKAPINALNAVFQPYQLKYWEEHEGRLFRREPRAAYMMLQKRCSNLTQGPHHSEILKVFQTRQVMDPATTQFIHHLLPVERRFQASMLVPTTAFMCHIPYLHEDMRVLRAVADCPDIDIFSTDGCCAIINFHWQREKTMATFRMAMAGIEVANFMAINIINDESWLLTSWTPIFVASIVSLIIWSVAMFVEVVQILGYVSKGSGRRCITETRHSFDVLVLLFTLFVNVALLTQDQSTQESRQDTVFCTILGVLVFCKWVRFLVNLRQLKTIGLKILPFMQALYDIVPFLIVFSIYLLATINFFFALNNQYSFWECFMLIYRLVVLLDFDLSELEHEAAPQSTVNLTTGHVSLSDAATTDNFLIVRGMLVVASFVIGVSLMNLYLAMLCMSYAEAHEKAELSYMRSRAFIVLDQHAVRVGIARLLCTRANSDSVDSCKSTTCANKLVETASASKTSFLWFVKQTDFESTMDVEPLADSRGETNEQAGLFGA